MGVSVLYTVRAADVRAHLFELSCAVARPDPAGPVFRLPGWLRGSYRVRDFAKHVADVQAEAGGAFGVVPVFEPFLLAVDKAELFHTGAPSPRF